MSLLDDIRNGAKSAISAVADLQISINILIESDPDYDPSTGDVSVGSNNVPVKAIKTKFTQSEKQAIGYEATDLKLLILVEDLPLVPTVNDIVLFDEKRYKIKDLSFDVSESILTLFTGI